MPHLQPLERALQARAVAASARRPLQAAAPTMAQRPSSAGHVPGAPFP